MATHADAAADTRQHQKTSCETNTADDCGGSTLPTARSGPVTPRCDVGFLLAVSDAIEETSLHANPWGLYVLYPLNAEHQARKQHVPF